MINQIRDWAAEEASIRTVLLVGSRAGDGKQDLLSDYDISLFGSFDKFAILDDWLNKIGPHLICIRDRFFWDENLVPTRLVIFENGTKADFAFHPSELLEKMIDSNQLSPTYDSGYQVIVDKDDRTANLPPASWRAYRLRVPSQEEFSNVRNEFWFEAYHVAKYLYRKDFWVAR
jgi:aminoglycoside 6-adenylyltransferase